MPKFKIDTPDGKSFSIEAPEGATQEQVNEIVRQHAGDYAGNPIENRPAPQPEAPKVPMADPEDSLIADIGSGVAEMGRGVIEGGANVLDHAADWAQSGLNAAGQAISGSNWGDALNGGAKNDLAGQVAPGADGMGTLRGMGRFGGEVVASAPLGLLRGGALAQGAVGGALLSDKNDLLGVGMDALTGMAGGYGARALMRGASKVADPVVDEGLKTLINSGIRVTPGQYGRSTGGKLGALAARTEDRATSTPFVGSMVQGGRDNSLDDFARATINRAVGPIGLELPQQMKPGRNAVKWAGDKLSAAYDSLLPRLSVSGDEAFLSDLQGIHREAQTLAPARVDQFNSIVNDLGRFWQGGRNLTGESLKAVDTRLGERIRRFSTSPDADQQDLGDALQSVRDAVHDLAARQNPDFAGELSSINQGWKGLVQVEKASANSKAGISPAGYSQAVKQSSSTVRRRGYSRGEALNQDLSDAASDILPSDLGNSGTADRQLQNSLMGNAVGLIQAPIYAGARGATSLLTREGATSPGLAKLLEYGSRVAPIAAPAAIETLRR